MATIASTDGGVPIQSGKAIGRATNGSAEYRLPTAVPSNVRNDPKIDFHGNFIQLINGESAPTSATRHGINPATLEPMSEVPVATQDDLNNAVSAAKAAFKAWSKTPYEDRRSAVVAFADAIESLRTEFRDLLISEQGKPVSPSLPSKYHWSMFLG